MNTKWNLKQLYQSPNDPQIEKDIQKDKDNVELFVKKWKTNKEYTKDPKVLKDALDEYGDLTEGLLKPYFYIYLSSDLDQTNSDLKAKYNNIDDIYTKLQNQILFFTLKISKVSKSKQSEFLNASCLKKYIHLLEHMFANARYVLSEREEKVFNIMSKTSSGNWSNMLSELLNKQKLTVINEGGKKEELSYNEAFKYLKSQNKKVRDYAAKQICKLNDRYLEIAEFELNSILEFSKNNDEYRGVRRADEPRHLHDDIPTEAVDQLVETVSSHFNIPQRYYKIKARELGQKTIGYHERGVKSGKCDKKYSYKDSLEIVKKVFNGLDPEFGDIVNDFSTNGNYDVYPKEGKSGGAYCISISKNLPVYILLNHNNNLSDITTIAHESGHGIHAVLSRKQSSLNSGHPISLAEVASTFFEDFVLEDVLNSEKDEDFKTSVRMEKLSDDISSIFRQVAAYKFEQELHKDFREKGFLSKEYISELFVKHMHAYLGEAVDMDDSMRLGWIYWSHFRRPFYVYSYASGLLISKGLQSLVRENPRNIEKVKEFLSSGSTLSPRDVFGKMGIDITSKEFWERGIKEIERELELLENKL